MANCMLAGKNKIRNSKWQIASHKGRFTYKIGGKWGDLFTDLTVS